MLVWKTLKLPEQGIVLTHPYKTPAVHLCIGPLLSLGCDMEDCPHDPLQSSC